MSLPLTSEKLNTLMQCLPDAPFKRRLSEEIVAYGQACREAALKEAAQAALDAPLKSATQPVREACANAIRRLI